MKRILLTTTFFIHVILLFGQSNTFFNPDNLWIVLHGSFEEHIHPDDGYPYFETSWYKIGSDTIIEEINYKQFLISPDSLQTTWNYDGAIREVENKVYFYDRNFEFFLYDFDLNLNDTIELNYTQFDTLKYCLDSISIYQQNSMELKEFHFSTFFTEYPETIVEDIWIEGIGSIRGPFWYQTCASIIPCYHTYQLLCFHQNNTLVYSNPDYNVCFIDSTINASNDLKLENDIRIFPNPVKVKLPFLPTPIFN